MGYHLLEPIQGSPDTPHILFWKRLGIDYDLPIVPRDEAIPPNKLRLIVVKTVNHAGEITRDIGGEVEWDLYEPYGPAAVEPHGRFPPEEVIEQHRHADDDEIVDQVAGELPIPPEFFHEHQLEVGDYLECFVLEVLPSDGDEWIIPYPAQTVSPKGDTPDFDPNEIRSTVTHRTIELE